MPLVYHSFNPVALKKTLSNRYLIDFGSISEYIDEIKKAVSENCDIAFCADKCIDLVKLSLLLCEQILPANYLDFFGKKNTEYGGEILYNDNDVFSISSEIPEHQKDSLLKYVAMDAYLHMCKYASFSKSKKNSSQRNFYLSKIANGNESQYKAVMKNHKASRDVLWLLDFRTDKERRGVLSGELSSYLPKTSFLLIQNIKTNPYYKKMKKDGIAEYPSLSLKKLVHFFVDGIYSQMRGSDESQLNFKYDAPAQQAAGYYYLDLLFDFENISYIAAELAKKDGINDLFLKEVINVLYQTVLIPIPFSKKKYIDIMFSVLDNDSEAICPYKDFRAKNPVLEQLGYYMDQTQLSVKSKNLMLCREYIQYLSKIYFPLISACFYVLLFEVFGNVSKRGRSVAYKDITRLLEYIAKEKVIPYYDKQFEDWEETYEKLDVYYDAPNSDENADVKKFDNYICQLYDAIRLNIYDDDKKYTDIINSLKIDGELRPIVKMHILNQIIDSKISANQDDLSDPVPNEHHDQKPIAICDLFSDIWEEYRKKWLAMNSYPSDINN